MLHTDKAAVIRKRLHIFHRRHNYAPGPTSAPQNWYWHVALGNGEVVAQGEMYENKADMVGMLVKLFDLDEDQRTALNEHGLLAWTAPA